MALFCCLEFTNMNSPASTGEAGAIRSSGMVRKRLLIRDEPPQTMNDDEETMFETTCKPSTSSGTTTSHMTSSAAAVFLAAASAMDCAGVGLDDEEDDEDSNESIKRQRMSQSQTDSPMLTADTSLNSTLASLDATPLTSFSALSCFRSELTSKESRKSKDQLRMSSTSFTIFNTKNETSSSSENSISSSFTMSSESESSSSSSESDSEYFQTASSFRCNNNSTFMTLSDSLKLNLILNDNTNLSAAGSSMSLLHPVAQNDSNPCGSGGGDSKQFIFKQINKLFKYNLNSLNLMKKETLLFLVESNYANKLIAPFDQLAYSRLSTSQTVFNSPNSMSKLDFNYSNIKKLNKLLKLVNYNPLDKRFLKKNLLLPNCVSSLLMPFFFDIFKMTELQSRFNKEQINLILNLKRSYGQKANQYNLDYEVLTSYYKENLVWNCFALYKYRFFDSYNPNYRMAFFNYYLSYVYIQIHLESVVWHYQSFGSSHAQCVRDHVKKAIDVGLLLAPLLNALIVNGLFKHSDYLRFKRFYTRQNFMRLSVDNNSWPSSSENNNNNKSVFDLERRYFDNAMKSLESKCENCFPLKLKHLCRIKVKESLKKFDISTVSRLNLPTAVKSFLLYDDEIEQYFIRNRNLFTANNPTPTK